MRTCPACKQELSLDNFYKHPKTRTCKPCTRARNRAWVVANLEKNRELKRASKKRCYTLEKRRREYNAPGYLEKQRERARKARLANPAKHRLAAKERKLHVAIRTPAWLTAVDKQYIRDIYRVAQIFTANSVEDYHVDHIIPLRGKKVNGLHVPSNLRILESKQNQKKHANFG